MSRSQASHLINVFFVVNVNNVGYYV